ncbi:MAG: 4-phosphoerythronate dehydrogenase [Bacteroidales bacterium]
MKIIVDHKIPFIQGALDKVADVRYLPANQISQADIQDADALIIRTRTRCTRDLLDNSSVKFIATATIGYDHIDTDYCDAAGIAWTNAPGCNSSSVEQYIVSALLHLAVMRRFQLKEKTVGIVGVGNVGSKIERVAKVLGCRVLLNDPPREAAEGKGAFTELGTLLREADIVTMHVPLIGSGMYKTDAMADGQFFGQMKEGAVFINTSRGEVVDEGALKRAIVSGKIADAVLDVFRNEPDIDQELVSMLTIATPHIAGYSTDGKANGTMMSVRAVSRFFGLGLDDWEPEGVPLPAEREIFVDGEDSAELEIISDAHGQTYRIMDDHKALVAGSADDSKSNGDPKKRKVADGESPMADSDGNINIDSDSDKRAEQNKEALVDGSGNNDRYSENGKEQNRMTNLVDPERFESLRGGYRVRREPSVYSVKLFNDDGKYRKIFEGLGFNVLGDSCF